MANTASTHFSGRSYRILQLAIEDIRETDRNVDVVIIPPDANYETDEDDIIDDNIQSGDLPFDVPGEVEIFSQDSDESDESDNLPLTVLRDRMRMEEPANKKVRTVEIAPKWTDQVIDLTMNDTDDYLVFENLVKNEISSLNPCEIFEKLFSDDLEEYIVQESLRYAQQKNNHSFKIAKEDVKIFIGFLLYTGYHQLPREKLYWCVDEDFDSSFVRNCMSRNRYYEIKKYLHLANNENIDMNDKMYKLRPIIEKLNAKFQQWGIFHKHLSIDEAMVKYYGHHSSKQFIRGKPVRFGYKDWMLCSSTGYCYKFDIYCGAKQQLQQEKYKGLPLGSKVVLELLEAVKNPANHILYFDNFFTSHSLMKTLRDYGFRATGTVRNNRTKNCPLANEKQMKKKNRGYYTHMYDSENSLLLVRWKDNSIVTMMTNFDSIEPLSRVKRWCKEEKEKVDVPQPYLFAGYNSGMGGVDLLDQAVNNYRVSVQGKKWWWPLWTHLLNITVVNAWKLHVLAGGQLDLLNFLRNVTRHYMRSFSKASISRHPPTTPQSIVQDSRGHFPCKLEKQLRCRVCHNRARWSCLKCKVTLCLERDCFMHYHSEQM